MVKLLWIAALSTALLLNPTPAYAQEESPTFDAETTSLAAETTEAAAATTRLDAATTVQPAAEPTIEQPPPPPVEVTGEPVPEDGSEYDITEDSEYYNIIPHLPEGCNDVRVFSARGSDEPYPGRGGAMLGVMCALFESNGQSCDYEDVVYPANISYSGIFCQSANKGAYAGQAQMTEYAQRCPDSKIVLTGYSQGGSVVGDILGGGGGVLFGCDQPFNPPLSRKTVPGSHSKFPQLYLAAPTDMSQSPPL